MGSSLNHARALSVLSCVLLLTPYARAEEADDEGPHLVGSSEELELERRQAAPPVLSVFPGKFVVRVLPGEVARKSISVENSGGQVLNWSAACSANWLTMDPASGALEFGKRQTIEVLINTSGMTPGSMQTAITIESDAVKGSPATTAVDLMVRAPKKPDAPRRAESTRRPDVSARRPGTLRQPADARLQPEDPPLPPRRRQRTESSELSAGFGVRAGYLMAGAGGNDVTGGSALVSGTFSFGGNSNMSWEVGLEFAGRRGTNDYTSWPIGARLEAIFGRGSAYLLAGGAGLLEFVTDDLTDEQYTNGVMTVDLGGGLRIGGSADLRLRYEVLLGSDNLDGQAAVSMGYAF